ncbi:MAG: N-formylglutamate amidohydrolase [Planctomycetaceae bacterium]|nr:N-formylglutamate amidohydrolase [Planctomycetaceae bacterium]MCB9954044.1 N-formylglutamate amidohydrolase [Planctomycetaceae bacterium]
MREKPRPQTLVFSCEHGGNEVPAAYRHLFVGADAALASHRGWDPGTLPLARFLAKEFDAPLVSSTVSRLLVELNRSRHHRSLFSDWSKPLSPAEKEQVLIKYYYPYRTQLAELIGKRIAARQRVLHVSVHSFTPELNGQKRNFEIGLLYDPKRKPEQEFCLQWQQQLESLAMEWRIRRNAPYRGAADGLTTALRKQFHESDYLGIELEVNQLIADGSAEVRKKLRRVISASLRHSAKEL